MKTLIGVDVEDNKLVDLRQKLKLTKATRPFESVIDSAVLMIASLAEISS